MTLVINNAQEFRSGVFSRSSVSISLGNGVSRGGTISTMDASSFVILPGFVDVHVHLREPGFSYKETVFSGTVPKDTTIPEAKAAQENSPNT